MVHKHHTFEAGEGQPLPEQLTHRIKELVKEWVRSLRNTEVLREAEMEKLTEKLNVRLADKYPLQMDSQQLRENIISQIENELGRPLEIEEEKLLEAFFVEI